MEWTAIKASDIPSRNNPENRNSWKPDVNDVTAVFSMALNGTEAIKLDFKDSVSASKKADAMLRWIKTQTVLPVTMTAFARGTSTIITDIRLLEERNDGQE